MKLDRQVLAIVACMLRYLGALNLVVLRAGRTFTQLSQLDRTVNQYWPLTKRNVLSTNASDAEVLV